MPDFRCYCRPLSVIVGDTFELSPEESNHLVAANRARPGATVRVFDGEGHECDARLKEANKRKAKLQIEEIHSFAPPPYKIALAQALPKGKLLESIIRKATEIGVQKIFPVASARTESRVRQQKTDSKNAKWTTAALEGAKQSGNPFPVDIEPLSDFADLLKLASEFQLKLIASLQDDSLSLKAHLNAYANQYQKKPDSIIWLIGPEGDFTPEEYKMAKNAGFLPATLGKHVMRSETAAVHALGITQYELSS